MVAACIIITIYLIYRTYGYFGMGLKALSTFDALVAQSIKPDKVCILSVLTACSRAGLSDEALILYNNLGKWLL